MGTVHTAKVVLARIARTHCKLCGALGHWRAECPQRKEARESANVVGSRPVGTSDSDAEACQVLFEELSEKECISCETCLITTCDLSLCSPPRTSP